MKYERLTVLKEFVEQRRSRSLVRCDCGVEKVVLTFTLRNGTCRSCGCLNRDRHRTHGMYDSPTYRVWRGMKARAGTKRYYEHVSVCPRWEKFENFYADMGEKPAGLMIDRIDSRGDYEPSNCRWVTMAEQNKNRRPPPLKKATQEKVERARSMRSKGRSYREIGKALDVGHQTAKRWAELQLIAKE